MSVSTLDATRACLYGICIPPTLVIWVISFFTVRQRGDRLRRPFHWMKAAYPLLAVSLILYVSGDALKLIDSDNWWLFDVLAGIGILFEGVANLALLICLVELGISFLSSSGAHLSNKIARWSVMGLSVVLGIVLVASVVQREVSLVFPDYNYTFDYSTGFYERQIHYNIYNAIKVGASFDIILWAASFLVTVLGSFVMYKLRAKSPLRSSAISFLVATVLNLLRNTWELAADVAWQIPNNSTPPYVEVVDPILGTGTTVVILVLIYAIGCQKQKGLWSTITPLVYIRDI